jgi:hypothetical protein
LYLKFFLMVSRDLAGSGFFYGEYVFEAGRGNKTGLEAIRLKW